MMTKPNISQNYTIDDIHKIREWNYEKRKNMSRDESIKDVQKGASEFLKLVGKEIHETVKK